MNLTILLLSLNTSHSLYSAKRDLVSGGWCVYRRRSPPPLFVFFVMFLYNIFDLLDRCKVSSSGSRFRNAAFCCDLVKLILLLSPDLISSQIVLVIQRRLFSFGHPYG
uniref:Uncharacterized protein n=1 Tax=Brassica oleracea var. oleracea TaxID=109376 RepID=A0A0D3E5A6_BRAOL